MKRNLASGVHNLGKKIVVITFAQLLVWGVFGSAIGASNIRLGAAISQANLSKLINASISVNKLPSSVTPSLSVLASKGDFGSTSASGSCGSIETGAWQENISRCYFGDTTSNTTVALIGDSRASMYLDTFAELGKLEHFKVLYIAKDGCPSPLGTYMTNNNGKLGDAVYTACSKFHLYLISKLKKIKPQVIIVSSNSQIDLTNPVHEAAGPEVQTDMVAFLSRLPSESRVIVLGGFPQPAPVANPTLCLSRNPSKVKSCSFTPSASTQKDNQAFASAAAAEGDAFINQTPWFCTSTCPAVVGKHIPYTIDAYHADNSYLQFLIGVLWSSVKHYIH